ncbi:MAG: efflux RND transporter periplasmic adaptor subunit [Gemmatimonadales bacterium]
MTQQSSALLEVERHRRFAAMLPRGRLIAIGVIVGSIAVAYIGTRRAGPDAVAPPKATAATGATDQRSVKLTAAEAERIGVTYGVVIPAVLAHEIRVVGQVSYDERLVSAINPKLDGWVETLYLNTTGQLVRAGQPLLELYSPMVVAAEEELLLAKRLSQDVSGAEPGTRQGVGNLVESARRRLSFWDVPADEIARVERTGIVRKTVTLRAPFSGFVLEKNVVRGQKIMAGETLFRIADLSRLWIEGSVFERDLPAIHLGATAAIEISAVAGAERTGRIEYIYPTLDSLTRTARIRVVVPNSDFRLKPGMYATMKITNQGLPVLSVPRSSVLSTGRRNIVFVKRADGMLEPHEVTLGAVGDDRIEIRSGLSPGDTIVASGTFLVDAESKLGEVLGGMGNMPGMDIAAPRAPGAPAVVNPPTPKTSQEKR